MSNGDMQKALGSLSLVGDKPVKTFSPKLQSTEPGTDNDPLYLALTYCFDMMRRMEYIFIATKGFALQGDPELARQIRADNRILNEDGPTWKQRAEAAETIMLTLFGKIETEHNDLLNQVAGPEPSGR